MILAGRGISVKRGLLSDSAQVVLVLALLLLCAQSWGACHDAGTGVYNGSGNGMSAWLENCGGDPSSCCVYGYNGYSYGTLCSVGSRWQNSSIRCDLSQDGGRFSVSFSCIWCDTRAEADSVKCVQNPTAEGCVEEDVPSACEADYQQCVGLGGVWKKVASTSTQCASTCNLCNSSAETKVKNRLNQVCCQQGKAPPDSNTRCIPPTIGSNWGMAGSNFVGDDGSVQCGSLTTSDGEIIQENADLYKKFCLDGDQYEEQADSNQFGSSSSAESSSSSEEPKSSWQTELEGLEGLYGVLDTIRDTLSRRLTPATEEIRDCLYNFKLCVALEPLQIDWTGMPRDTSMLQIDTAILKHVKPMMDSSVKLDSAQLKVLKQLDSLYKRGLVNDTDIVQAVNAIEGDINDVETAVKGVKHGIDSLIDSMTTYMDKVGQGLSAVGDSVGALRGVVEGLFDTTGIGAAMSAAGSSVDTAGWGAFSDTLSGRYGKLITKASVEPGEILPRLRRFLVLLRRTVCVTMILALMRRRILLFDISKILLLPCFSVLVILSWLIQVSLLLIMILFLGRCRYSISILYFLRLCGRLFLRRIVVRRTVSRVPSGWNLSVTL